MNKKYFLKFFGLNAILGVVVFLVLLVFTKIIEIPNMFYLFYGIMLILVYFAAIIYTYFTKEKQEVFSSIGKGLTIGFVKIKKLIMPALFVVMVFVFVSLISFGLQKLITFKYLPLILLILFSAWARPYFVSEAKKVV